ncbi:hypothetical protein ACFVGY_04360 [Streptomyces sp. NPDC127106]|uniref:hypothetical protein n=1 Tax=Streptomyces sp. NPDC127106 TaxID=3345360 RepID=UPI00363BF92E
MTAAPAPDVAPLTVRVFLLGQQSEESVETIAGTLHDHHAAAGTLPDRQGLTGAADRAVESELARVVNGFLDLDLFSLLAHGWAKHSELRAAAHRTRLSPEAPELVALATHSITSTHRPSVEVLVDGAPVSTVEVELTVVFHLRALVAAVESARLTELHSGQCDIEAKLAVRGIPVATRQGRLALPLGRRLRSPIELLPPQAPPPPAQPPHFGAG